MGYSQSQKRKNHERLLRTGALWMRKSGLENVGARELMGAAKLTHGAFYSHFASKDDMVEQLLECALRDGVELFRRHLERLEQRGISGLIEEYLSPNHRDLLSAGCGFAALVGDVARSRKNYKASFTRQFKGTVAYISRLCSGPRRQREDKALEILLVLIGALNLARAVDEEALSRRILSLACAILLEKYDSDATHSL